jgi:hypothetical protein
MTSIPAVPSLGAKLLITGVLMESITSKSFDEVEVLPFTVTVIFPDIPPVGTTAVNCVAVALSTDAVTPPNFTVLSATVVLKLFPVITTSSPAVASVGKKPVITGGCEVGGDGCEESFFEQPINKKIRVTNDNVFKKVSKETNELKAFLINDVLIFNFNNSVKEIFFFGFDFQQCLN